MLITALPRRRRHRRRRHRRRAAVFSAATMKLFPREEMSAKHAFSAKVSKKIWQGIGVNPRNF
jgi:hypothetical protein